jgi:hypothetical protein
VALLRLQFFFQDKLGNAKTLGAARRQALLSFAPFLVGVVVDAADKQDE